MASSDPEHSIAGISLPQWMKSKITDRYDLENSAFSPPTDDDGFFLIPYPKAKSSDPEPKIVKQHQYKPISQILEFQETPKQVLDRHTDPCQQFIPQAKLTPREIGMRRGIDPPLGRVKSTGTDDGFKGDGAACGYSVVAVAQQILSEKSGSGEKLPFPRERMRRNSKSLPASPQTSPKLLKKNPYFTNILFGSIEAVDRESGLQRSGRLLSAAVESQKNSMEDISERHKMAEAAKLSHQLSEGETPATVESKLASRTFKAKPSELREMNFWSPTSM